MNYRIDNLQYCNWSREVFQINRDAGLDAVHVTLVYHEDFDEFLIVYLVFLTYLNPGQLIGPIKKLRVVLA